MLKSVNCSKDCILLRILIFFRDNLFSRLTIFTILERFSRFSELWGWGLGLGWGWGWGWGCGWVWVGAVFRMYTFCKLTIL